MTITQEAVLTEVEQDPCPAWCLGAKYGHAEGDESHRGGARTVELSCEPARECQYGSVTARMRVNSHRGEGSDARLILTTDGLLPSGEGVMMTSDEGCELAADLLAAVVESTGLDGVSRYSEETARAEHARLLLEIRAAMLRAVIPTAGAVIEANPGRAFYCPDCSEWVDIPATIRRAKADHLAEVHASGAVPA